MIFESLKSQELEVIAFVFPDTNLFDLSYESLKTTKGIYTKRELVIKYNETIATFVFTWQENKYVNDLISKEVSFRTKND